MTRRRDQAGFTLVELMVAMVVSGIVLLGVYAFSAIQQSVAAGHQRHVRVQQALEGAMGAMASDVRMAGRGFARRCTELRIFDDDTGQLVNPGAMGDPALAVRDVVTDEPYWVLRDGLQAHWRSRGATSLTGSEGRSGDPQSAADSVDVILAGRGHGASSDAFTLVDPAAIAGAELVVETSAQLDNLDPDHLAAVQQLFVPGSFVLVAAPLGRPEHALRASVQQPCGVLQLTGDVQPDPASPHRWRLPIDGAISGFDAAPLAVVGPVAGDERVLPLGRLRWSRYEIDYTVAEQPYLVRHDIIGHRAGVDPEGLGTGPDYPECAAGACPAPQLHLPGRGDPPPAIAVGPMIEDLQVAVGCDGNDPVAALAAGLPAPDPGFEEPIPNTRVDERAPGQGRDRDEWLGNARHEQWAPDCVGYGTAHEHAATWAGLGVEDPPLSFRMSPQMIRITLVGAAFTEEASGGVASALLPAVEDRPPVASPAGRRLHFTLTELFAPKNLRWRDPTVP